MRANPRRRLLHVGLGLAAFLVGGALEEEGLVEVVAAQVLVLDVKHRAQRLHRSRRVLLVASIQ